MLSKEKKSCFYYFLEFDSVNSCEKNVFVSVLDNLLAGKNVAGLSDVIEVSNENTDILSTLFNELVEDHANNISDYEIYWLLRHMEASFRLFKVDEYSILADEKFIHITLSCSFKGHVSTWVVTLEHATSKVITNEIK